MHTSKVLSFQKACHHYNVTCILVLTLVVVWVRHVLHMFDHMIPQLAELFGKVPEFRLTGGSVSQEVVLEVLSCSGFLSLLRVCG